MIKKLFIVGTYLVSVAATIFFLGAPVHAMSFDPTHIIDDGVFYNSSSMSVQDIQNFLNSKVPSCDTNGTQQSEFGGGTRAQYGTAHGYPPPYICLKDYYENPSTLANNLSGTIPAGAISAAQIIYNASQAYSINPQVIIVTLQKESSLVTDTWPFPSQYRTAMGYGCPDSGPNNSANCNSNYYGFYNQVTDAAWQFRQYATNPNNYNFVPGAGNYVQYNPNTACGGTTLNIQNQATASLYDYTPYQPDASALAAGYGTGDSCGAYGNRNFWLYFNDWFGTTYGTYYASYYSESPYPDIVQGKSSDIVLKFKNSATATWYDSSSAPGFNQSPVVLATFNPVNRQSDFSSPSWYAANRPAGLFSKVYESDGVTLAQNQHIALPGQIIEYDITLSVPYDYQPGVYNEFFGPIREGAANWFMGANNVYETVTVLNGYQASYYSQSDYPTIQQNDKSSAFFKFKNTGTYSWYDGSSAGSANQLPVTLATDGPINRLSGFGATWPTANRPADVFSKVYESDGVTLAQNQHIALPGQIIEYDFQLTVGQSVPPQSYREYFSLVHEGAKIWRIDNSTVYLDVSVRPSNIQAAYYSQSPYPTMNKGQKTLSQFKFKNVGDTVWYDDVSKTTGILPIHLATTGPINRISQFFDQPTWPTANRPADVFSKVYESDGVTLAQNQHIALPGQIIEYDITLSSSQSASSSREYFQPILEGGSLLTWNLQAVVWLQITVQ